MEGTDTGYTPQASYSKSAKSSTAPTREQAPAAPHTQPSGASDARKKEQDLGSIGGGLVTSAPPPENQMEVEVNDMVLDNLVAIFDKAATGQQIAAAAQDPTQRAQLLEQFSFLLITMH